MSRSTWRASRWLTILGMCSVVVMGGASATRAQELSDADRSAIAGLSDRYLQALVDGDVNALASLFVEDGIRLVNGGPVTHGRAEIQAAAVVPVGASAGDFTSFRTGDVTIEGEGSQAYSWLEYDITFTTSEGAEPSTFYGRFLNVVRKQPDGTWLFAALMFNARPSP